MQLGVSIVAYKGRRKTFELNKLTILRMLRQYAKEEKQGSTRKIRNLSIGSQDFNRFINVLFLHLSLMTQYCCSNPNFSLN